MSDRSVAVAARRWPLHAVSLPKGETFAVTRAPDAARFVLRGDPAGVAAFGPAAPGMLRGSESGSRAALRLGPDEILLLAPGVDAEVIRGELAAKLPAGAHSLVDVSHRQIGLVVEGRSAALFLAAGCPLDLRPAAFPIGMVTRTIFLKAEIVLWRQAEDRFHVEVWRSFAPYLVGHLSDAHAGSSDP